MEKDFLAFMPATITREPFTGRNPYGEPTYGTGAQHRARVEGKQQLVRTAGGQEKMSETLCYVAGPVTITVEDRITLPDATQPPILTVASVTDETGAVHHAKVWF